MLIYCACDNFRRYIIFFSFKISCLKKTLSWTSTDYGVKTICTDHGMLVTIEITTEPFVLEQAVPYITSCWCLIIYDSSKFLICLTVIVDDNVASRAPFLSLPNF
jgi:hypothetical protein